MPEKTYPQKGDFPAQTQLPQQPGLQHEMEPQPFSLDLPEGYDNESVHPYKAANKLESKIAFITGGDSGIGRAVAVLFAKEGADIAINYLPVEEKDAKKTKALIESEGRKCLLVPGDISEGEIACKKLIDEVAGAYGKIDILVNNAAVQYMQQSIMDITSEQLEKTFKVNILAQFWLTKAALPYMPQNKNSSIINSTSVVAYKGSPSLLDYSSTKGAIVGFTRSLALQLKNMGIRVNAVAPGPIWTPLQPASRTEENIESWTDKVPTLGRIGQPAETATSYVFLASDDSSYFTGQVLHPNGGYIING